MLVFGVGWTDGRFRVDIRCGPLLATGGEGIIFFISGETTLKGAICLFLGVSRGLVGPTVKKCYTICKSQLVCLTCRIYYDTGARNRRSNMHSCPARLERWSGIVRSLNLLRLTDGSLATVTEGVSLTDWARIKWGFNDKMLSISTWEMKKMWWLVIWINFYYRTDLLRFRFSVFHPFYGYSSISRIYAWNSCWMNAT